MDLTVIFPCLNEAETLGSCLDELAGIFSDSAANTGIEYEILVVDNGSIDNTAEIARSRGARVVREKRRGYGAAIAAGIRESSGKYFVFADADGSYPLECIPEMYTEALRSGADMVVASRFRGVIEPGAMPWSHRYIGTPVLTFLINLLYHGRLTDCNSGFRLIRKEAFDSWGVHSDGMEFASELLIKALKASAKIVEIPGGLRKDKRSRPPHLKTWRDGMRHLLFILSEAPRLFETGGLFLFLLGVAIQISCTLTGLVDFCGIVLGGIHTGIFALVLSLFGLQCYLLSCFLIQSSPDEKSFRLTRRLISMPEEILFFTLLLLGAALLLFTGVIVCCKLLHSTSFGVLLLMMHLAFLLFFMIFGLLSLHIVGRKRIASV